MYDKKLSKKREAEEAKKKRKDKRERRKAEKEQQKKQGGGVRTRGGLRMSIQTRGGKRNWQYIPPEDLSTEEEVEHDEEDRLSHLRRAIACTRLHTCLKILRQTFFRSPKSN